MAQEVLTVLCRPSKHKKRKNKDINLGSNNANNHIPKAMVQLRCLTAASPPQYIMASKKCRIRILQTNRVWKLTSIPGKIGEKSNLSHWKDD